MQVNGFYVKTKPYDHQVEALVRSWDHPYYAYFMEMGCVDAETEYLSPEGWRKISDYVSGPVAQFHLDGTAEFVEPTGYLKKPCAEMYHFTSTRGLDQMLSPGHRMLVLRPNKNRVSANDTYFREQTLFQDETTNGRPARWCETTPEELVEHGQGSSHVWPVFNGCSGKGLGLTDDELRVMVAFHADGSFGTKDLSTVGPKRQGTVRLKKKRKIDRLHRLLFDAFIPYHTYVDSVGFTVFRFIPPAVSKTYADWWAVSDTQKKIILDEVFHWDSREKVQGNRGRMYSSIHKEDADFIQFCAVSTGQRCRVAFRSDGTWSAALTGSGRTNNKVFLKHAAKKVPSPDGYMYCFQVPTGYLVLRRNGCVFTSGNTGKSKVLIDNITALYLRNKINFALVIAPKGVYANWPDKEIPDHFPEDIPVRVIQWYAQPNKTQQREMAQLKEPFSGLTIFVMNVEAFSTVKGVNAGLWLAKTYGAKGLIAVDESTTIKNHKAKRTKSLNKIAKGFAYRRILTGSPVSRNPMDVFAQGDFLESELLGPSYYAFQSRYAITQKRTMGAHSFQQIVGYQRLDELNERLERWSFRVLKKDCLDLPEKTFTVRKVTLSAEQYDMYEKIRREAILLLENGELVSTPQVVTQMLRLQQILSGHLTSDDGDFITFPSPRLDVLKEILAETSGKALIWSRFRHDIELITAELQKEYGKDAAASYYGDTTTDERARVVREFQDPANPLRFFVGNPATAGYGLTLTEASTVIYYANNFSLEHRLQSQDRAHRIGQKNPVLYIDLLAPNTIDDRIVESLKQKIDLGAAVLGEQAQEWLDIKPKKGK